jgi:hypothetical protein
MQGEEKTKIGKGCNTVSEHREEKNIIRGKINWLRENVYQLKGQK